VSINHARSKQSNRPPAHKRTTTVEFVKFSNTFNREQWRERHNCFRYHGSCSTRNRKKKKNCSIGSLRTDIIVQCICARAKNAVRIGRIVNVLVHEYIYIYLYIIYKNIKRSVGQCGVKRFSRIGNSIRLPMTANVQLYVRTNGSALMRPVCFFPVSGAYLDLILGGSDSIIFINSSSKFTSKIFVSI
jgi:hypothetical protein